MPTPQPQPHQIHQLHPSQQPRPQLIASRPATTAAKVNHGRNIDGILIGSPAQQPQPVRAGAPQPASRIHTATAPTYTRPAGAPKSHLQAHPLLQRRYTGDIRPANAAAQPAPVSYAAPAAQKRPTHPAAAAGSHYTKPLQPAGNLPPIAQGLGKETPLNKLSDSIGRLHLSKLAALGIVMAALLVSLSLFSLQLGQIVLGVYAVIAIWKRIASRLSFMLALFTFGGIIVTQLLSADSGIADNLAVYAFLLLCIGTVSLAREVRRQGNGSHATVAASTSNGGGLSKSL